MNDHTTSPSFLAMLFFGADILAMRALDTRLARVRATNSAIANDHELDTLVGDIEDARADGEAAMGGTDGT